MHVIGIKNITRARTRTLIIIIIKLTDKWLINKLIKCKKVAITKNIKIK